MGVWWVLDGCLMRLMDEILHRLVESETIATYMCLNLVQKPLGVIWKQDGLVQQQCKVIGGLTILGGAGFRPINRGCMMLVGVARWVLDVC